MVNNIAIVGAGPAGASLAIRLATDGFDVTLAERESFPRHKLCGEFISPECLGHFASLGVLDVMTSAGGDRIRETRFFSPSGRSVSVPSEWLGFENALSLSRSEMDLQLMQRAKEAGVRVIENANVNELLRCADGSVVGVCGRLDGGETFSVEADVTVDATGRASLLTRMLAKTDGNPRSGNPDKPAFVGFKAHLRNARIGRGCCEIYFFNGGYAGLSNVENGVANLCFLVDARIVRKFKSNVSDIVENVVSSNVRAKAALAFAIPVGEWLAVSIGGFGRKDLNPANGLFAIGDSAAFIDPFTGSGMLLALESSEVLADAIGEHRSRPDLIAETFSREYAARFGSRLRAASLLRRAAFIPAFASSAILLAGCSTKMTKLLARLTRQKASQALGGH